MREHVSFRVDAQVVERLRNAVHALRGAPLYLTLDGYVEAVLAGAATRLERKHNGGERWGKLPRRAKRSTE